MKLTQSLVLLLALSLTGLALVLISTPTARAAGPVSQSLTANATVGSYAVIADTTGAVLPATFLLANYKQDTATSLASSANPAVPGQSIAFTASVSGISPGGSVTFRDGGTTLAGCAAVALSAGSVQCVMPAPALGTHDITPSTVATPKTTPAAAPLPKSSSRPARGP